MQNNPGHLVALATKFGTVAPNILGFDTANFPYTHKYMSVHTHRAENVWFTGQTDVWVLEWSFFWFFEFGSGS
jgi:hypothetical protein